VRGEAGSGEGGSNRDTEHKKLSHEDAAAVAAEKPAEDSRKVMQHAFWRVITGSNRTAQGAVETVVYKWP
jgi:hypothetical protein